MNHEYYTPGCNNKLFVARRKITECKAVLNSLELLLAYYSIRDCFFGGRTEPTKLIHNFKQNNQKQITKQRNS